MMRKLVVGTGLLAFAGLAQAGFVISPAQGLTFSNAAVRKYESKVWRQDLAQREKSGELGCRTDCARLRRIFTRLEGAARALSAG